MAVLTVRQNGREYRLPFSGTPTLDGALETAGLSLPHPCGGRGKCRKCAVTLSGAVSAPNAAERAAGCRLSCQAVLLGDAEAVLPDTPSAMRIETETGEPLAAACPMPGRIGAAVDIGTTTLAVKLYDLASGRCIGTAAAQNPQTAVAADVMGRIGAALAGGLPRLREQVQTALAELCETAGGGAVRPDCAVVTGNTAMLYLLTGRDPSCLARAPFIADTRFDTLCRKDGADAYLPPCMDAFVGADITCAVLASGLTDRPDTALLCDIGTNGELALWHGGRLYVASTAAGPAFEGAGISCGCGSVAGAIDRVWAEDGRLCIHTIDDVPAVGICGSGLLDAVAAALSLGLIDETGAMEEDELPLAAGVSLKRADIRAVQAAKAAIAAGIAVLLETAGISAGQVTELAIAGGFGSHLQFASAAAIGLLPAECAGVARVLGNAALAGAARVLLDTREREHLRAVAAAAVPVALGGSARFNEQYVECMLFPEE